ncbi:unnamed protein product [Rotaria sp. Silwood1]|nr:unnamed protein product [Rotaria sp. Silwood1]
MKYPVQKLVDAINSDLSSIEASKHFKVPERTIRSHRQNPEQKFGGGRYRCLNNEQEDFLLSIFKLLPEYGFTITADVAFKLSNEYFKSIGLNTEIKWRKQQKLEQIRAKKFTEETRKSWFVLLKSTLIKLDLMDKPAQIFNCDETGFSDITQRKHVIVTSSTRYVFEKHGGSGKQYTTALIAISTAGHVISPFIIYSGKVLMNTWCKGGSDGSRYAVTKKGWINSCSFEYWLREMFIPATQHLNRSLLLVMDGHNAHMNINIIQLMKQHNIVCLILPPHCTHTLQPIDVVVFNNVKTDWSNIVINYLKSGNKSIKNADIPHLMKQLFIAKQSFSNTRIVSSFSRSGIWPFNENAMMQSVVAPGFSPSFDPRIINQILPSPTNILIPCSGSSIVQSSYTILPLQKPVTTSNVQSINESLNSGMMIIDHTSEKEQQMLCDVRRIQPIQQVFTDDHEIPSSDSTYTPLNMVDLNSSTFEPQSNFILQPTTQQNSQFMPMSLKEQNEQKQNKKPIVEAIHAVREVLVTLLEEQQQQQTTTASATTSRAS